MGMIRTSIDSKLPEHSPSEGVLRQRIREVRQGPDGLLYLLTDEDESAVLKLAPASKS